MEYNKTVTVTRDVTIKLSSKDIVKLLKDAGVISSVKNIDVEFTVPTGGDYSGMTVEIDEDHPIKIRYAEITGE